ncbi:hypothetical protein AN958_07359 [Leucoagaricus sp. SymC.cos]|nr:hypothetical protein AN958_07359 [Leucoagaricus sp. SymC.cos]
MATNEQKSAPSETWETEKQSDSEQQSARGSLSPEPTKGKGKEKSTQPESPPEEQQEEPDESSPDSNAEAEAEAVAEEKTNTSSSGAQPWQAIFAPQYNAYYFYNGETGETTWTNPLLASDSTHSEAPFSDPQAPSDSSTLDRDTSGLSTSQYTALQAAALAQGIDPSLAHLDPSLLTATASASGGPIPAFQAKFNARTGAFTRPDARTPGHLSEYERMKRMSEFYFDVNAWEQQLANDKVEEDEGNGKKRKRPTKKDLERFKEQKRQKKIAKTAWLRT